MNYDTLITSIAETHSEAQRGAAQAVNQKLVLRNWLVGAYIVEFEQNGQDRSQYGTGLLKRLANDLKSHEISGLGTSMLRDCRTFYRLYPQIRQPAVGEWETHTELLSISQPTVGIRKMAIAAPKALRYEGIHPTPPRSRPLRSTPHTAHRVGRIPHPVRGRYPSATGHGSRTIPLSDASPQAANLRSPIRFVLKQASSKNEIILLLISSQIGTEGAPFEPRFDESLLRAADGRAPVNLKNSCPTTRSSLAQAEFLSHFHLKIQIILFKENKVRRAWNDTEQQWYFSIADVIAILTESPNPQVYWRVMKKRLRGEGNESVTNCNALKMTAADGKQRLTDEWKNRGVKKQKEFAILTAEISKATFGMTPSQYKEFIF